MTEQEILKIPHERVKTLIGESGKVKEWIERRCNVTLDIDPEGDVEISGESTDIFFAKDIVKAIGRGFEPKDAMRLAGSDYNLHIIALRDITHSENEMTRLKGRVIGSNGKIRLEIESATDSVLCVFGNTIGIISKLDTMPYAREAIAMIIDGAPHESVIHYLAKAKREIYDSRLRGK